MKKLLLIVCVMTLTAFSASAQKFALIDMEYILKNVPEYTSASDQMEKLSKQWQDEVEKVSNEAKTMYENYQKATSLTQAQRTERENAIVNKEKEAADLRRKYFGNDGELSKKRQELIQPIMDDIYEIVKAIAQSNGYSVVLDRASASSIIFASPNIDISDEVLEQINNN